MKGTARYPNDVGVAQHVGAVELRRSTWLARAAAAHEVFAPRGGGGGGGNGFGDGAGL